MRKIASLFLVLVCFHGLSIAQTPTGITVIDDSGRPGDTIRIFGHFFTSNPGDHTVSFNGTSATIIGVTNKVLTVEVPSVPFGPAAIVVEANSFRSADNINFQVMRNDSGEILLKREAGVIASSTDIGQLTFGDLDDDGFLDMVGIGTVLGVKSLFWKKNDGTGNFVSLNLIEAYDFNFILLDDFDNDGRVDILASGSSNSSIFYNEGSGFTKILSNVGTNWEMISVDINYDGLIDIIAGGTGGAYISLNNGNRTFQNYYHVYLDDYDAETYATGVYAKDINNDNYADVLVASQRRGWTRAYLNDPSNPGSFTQRVNINPGNLQSLDVAGADLDNDGWNDVVSAALNAENFVYNRNITNNSFELYEYLTDGSRWPDRLALKDLNGDQLVDFIGGTINKDLVWFQNTGGQFSAKQAIPYESSTYYLPQITTADLDNDGDYDLSISNSIYWNQQNEKVFLSFQVPGQLGKSTIDVTNRTVDISLETSTDLVAIVPIFNTSPDAVASINGDEQVSGVNAVDFSSPVIYTIVSEFGTTNDWTVTVTPRLSVDFVEPSTAIPGSVVKIYGAGFDINPQNNTVRFGDQQAVILNDMVPSTNRLTVQVPAVAAGSSNVVVSNLNGESYSKTNFTVITTDQTDGIAWNLKYEWQTDQVTLSSINAEDLNNDGLYEIITTSSGDGKVAVRYNEGSEGFSDPVQIGPEIEGMKLTEIADFDRDGYLDILISSLGGAGWLRNDGEGNFPDYFEISSTELPVIRLADINADGKVDIAVSGFRYIKWYFNDGSGNFTEQTADKITTTEGFVNSFSGDFDDDGLYDLVAYSFNGAGTELYLNDGNGFVFNKLIQSAGNIFRTPWGVDLTGDGLMELISGSGSLYWSENLGGTNFGTLNQATTFPPKQYDFGDVDGDGDIDLAYARNGDTAGIFKFENGNYDLTQETIVNLFPLGDNRVKLSDIDNDGDLDFLAADAVADILFVFENQNADNDLYSFSIPGELEPSVVNTVGRSIIAKVSAGTNLQAIKSSFTLSPKARAFVNGSELLSMKTPVNFENEVELFIVSESGDSVKWTVQVLPVPFPPATQGTPFIGQTQVAYTWSTAEFATNYAIEVSRNAEFTDLVDLYNPAVVPGNSNTLFVVRLQPGTRYWLRISSVNEAGQSQPSSPTLIVTIPAAPEFELSARTQTSLTIAWGDIPNISQYNLEVYEGFTLVHVETINSGNSATITGLTPATNYEIRLSAENPAGESPFTIINEITVPEVMIISNLTFPETLSEEEASGNVSFSVSGGYGTYTATLFARGITASFWNELVLGGTNSYSFPVTANYLDAMGLEFTIRVTDELGTEVSTDNKFIYRSFPDDRTEIIPFSSGGGNANDWEMFSLPFVIQDNQINDIFNELGGRTYKKEWRLMTYQGGKYVDYGVVNRIEPGVGYWYNTVEAVDIKIEGLEVNREIPFQMPLVQGWNQIGNPYNISLSWPAILAENGVVNGQVGNLQIFDGTKQLQSTELAPFQGAFVWSDIGGNLSIVPATAKTGGRTEPLEVGRIEGSNIESEEWKIDFQISVDQDTRKLAGIGMHPLAEPLKDPYDRMMVPRFFTYTDLYTTHTEFSYPFFTWDIVPTSEQHSWEFTFESNQFEDPIEITWDNTEFSGSEAALYILNKQTGKLVDMKSETSLTLLNGPVQLEVLYSKDPELLSFGDQWMIGQIYPNPVTQSMKIPLISPEETYMEIIITDLNGRTIKKLKNGNSDGGYQEVTWDLRSDSGQKVEQGMYILIMRYPNMEQGIVRRFIVR